MSDKTARYVYWIATGLVALVYLGGAGFYISSYDMVAGMYREVLGYPTYIIWPLAILKIIGAVTILWRPSAMLADWAYAAMFWHLVLAFGAHVGAGDPGWPPAVVAWVLLIVSWLIANRVRAVKSAYAPVSSAAAN
ncbi:DoxX family protein [Seohaeicola saemankumensis]|uniref:DoxX family protein n=1 Tax=Seohaeicola saemankumensis TaxID=481181 RepID=UPI001E3EEEB5|nr:DoxX family protein [Seohaeicola saemankumensis]MCD1627971.1 DoxX family protein [Seohaeicola saemankumensis]